MKKNYQWKAAGLFLAILAVALCGCKQQSSTTSASGTNAMTAPASQTATNMMSGTNDAMNSMSNTTTNSAGTK